MTTFLGYSDKMSDVDNTNNNPGETSGQDAANLGKNGGLNRFMLVWSGQLVSILGSSMTGFALAIWAWMITGQATALALVGFFSFAPTIFLSPVAGALVDRWDRKKTMILSDLAAGIGTIVLLVLYTTGSLEIWHLYIIGFWEGAFGAFQFPAFSAATTMMVDKKHYARANGLMSIAGSASTIVAPIAAVALLTIIGIGGIMLIDIVTFIYAIAAVLVIPISNPKRSKAGEDGNGSIWKESMYGFKYITARRGLLGLLMFFLAFNLVSTFGNTVLAPMILARTASNEVALGTVQSMFGIGGLLGGIAIAVWGGPKYRIGGIILGSLCGTLFGVVLIGLGQTLMIWALGAFTAAVFFPMLGASSQSIWQSKVEPDVQGRVFACRRMLAQMAVPISMLLAGPLADKVFEPSMMAGGSLASDWGWMVGTGPGAGMALMLVFSGILTAIVTIVAFAIPSIRNLEKDTPDFDESKSERPVPTPAAA